MSTILPAAEATDRPTPTGADRSISPRDPRIATWRLFLTAHARLERLLDEDLRSEHDLSLAEYDVLIQLAESPTRRLRMHEIADRVILSRSGVTRLIDRLVHDGWVERSSCATDARGAEAVLTASGLAKLREASRTHLRGITVHFLDSMPPSELAAVDRAMTAIHAGLGPDTSPEDATVPTLEERRPV
jgi:DNA-binding MarR family transcriptional regulator